MTQLSNDRNAVDGFGKPLNSSGRTQSLGLDLLTALVNGNRLETAIPQALEIVANDPLTLAHFFRGDLLRALMGVPDRFWRSHPTLYDQYRTAVRAGALARLHLPVETRHEFWTPLELIEASNDQTAY